jgi:murein DD-endopeptidase MepM/ murein hydrolase activator NlpD
MIAPVNAPISSPFGPRSSGYHSGVDYAVPEGTSVSASTSGTVVRALT